MTSNDSLERARARLHNRVAGYRAVFQRRGPDEPLIDTAPWWAFWRKATPAELSTGGEIVLRDLARYCYANKSTIVASIKSPTVDPLAMAYAEGRRDVYLRITGLLNLDVAAVERIAQRNVDE